MSREVSFASYSSSELRSSILFDFLKAGISEPLSLTQGSPSPRLHSLEYCGQGKSRERSDQLAGAVRQCQLSALKKRIIWKSATPLESVALLVTFGFFWNDQRISPLEI